MTATDLTDLTAAADASPLDAQLRLVLADVYEEAGDDAEAARQRGVAAVLNHPLNADLPARLAAAVAKANGKMRARTIDARGAAWVAAHAAYLSLRGRPVLPTAYVDGGGVAAVRGRAASTALILAVVRKDGKVVVDGGQAAARKDGSSPANVWRELVQWRLDARLAARLEEWAASR